MVAATPKGKAQVVSREATTQQLADALNQVVRGRLNCVGKFTLRPNETTTPVTASNVGAGNVVVPFPMSATAATAIGAGAVYIAEANVIAGQFTVTHDSQADNDRHFMFIAIG